VTATARSSDRFADHWVFRSRADLPNKTAVALVGHLDTVFPPGAFEGYRQDGTHAFGPGVLDMKGGLVVIAFAMRALAETGGLDAVVPLRVVVVSDDLTRSKEDRLVIECARDIRAEVVRLAIVARADLHPSIRASILIAERNREETARRPG